MEQFKQEDHQQYSNKNSSNEQANNHNSAPTSTIKNRSLPKICQFQQIEQHRELTPINKKIQIFLCTFLAYTSVHALRTTYSVSKSFLPEQIQVEQVFIGIVDSLMIFCIGVGNLLTVLFPPSNSVRTIWIALLCCSLQFCFVPFTMSILSGPLAFSTLVILMSLNGFLSSFIWPNLLPFIYSVLSPDDDTTILGFWATSPNFGNIFGFVVMQCIVLNNGLSWQLGMYIAAGYMMINAGCIGFRMEELNNQQSQILSMQFSQNQQQGSQNLNLPLIVNRQLTSESNMSSSSSNSVKLSKNELQQPSIRQVLKKSYQINLLIISFSLFKSVMYGMLFWLPSYFYAIGLVEYSLYIPMTFDGAAIIGSTILGVIFKQVTPDKKKRVFIPVLFLLMLFFIFLELINFDVAGYLVMIGLVGLCLGGAYNTMAGLVTMELVRTVPVQLQSKYLRFYSALLMAIANTLTAITQIIISFTIHANDGKLFGIFLAYTFVNLCCVVALVLMEFYSVSFINKQKQVKEKSIKNQENKTQKSSISQVITKSGNKAMYKSMYKSMQFEQIK